MSDISAAADGATAGPRPHTSTATLHVAGHSSRSTLTTSLAADPALPVPAPQRSPNVRLTLIYKFLDGACYSMWGMQLLPVFLERAAESNVVVGVSATMCGVAQLIGAALTGYAADRHPRQRAIRVGAACALAALPAFLVGFWAQLVWCVLCAQAMWGLYTGVVSTSVEALFADSVAQGQRTSIYNTKWVVQTICYVVGYGAAAVLFVVWGNAWELQRVRVAMTAGVLAHPVALVPLCWLQDRYAIREEADAGADADGRDVHGDGEGEGGEVEDNGDRRERSSDAAALERSAPQLVATPHAPAHKAPHRHHHHHHHQRRAPSTPSSQTTPTAAAALAAPVVVGSVEVTLRHPTSTVGEEVPPPQREEVGGGVGEYGAAAAAQFRLAGVLPARPAAAGGGGGAAVAATMEPLVEEPQEAAAADARASDVGERSRGRAGTRRSTHDSCNGSGSSGGTGGRGGDARASAAAAAREGLLRHDSRALSRSAGASLFQRRRQVWIAAFCSGAWATLAWVPHWMCAVDLLLAVGSGMSLPYFPVFFAIGRGLSPAGLNGVYIASTTLTALTSSCLPWLIHTCGLGRIPTVIGVRLVGTTALLVLATAPAGSAFASLPGTVALFLCRNALMNSVFGVTRSVIMDCVRKDSRAKWSAFESVSTLSWAGSAVVGGFITERYGYHCNFIVTAVLQFAATLLMVPAAIGARALDGPGAEEGAAAAVEDVAIEEVERDEESGGSLGRSRASA